MVNNYQQEERQAAIAKRITAGRRKGSTCRCDFCGVNIGSQQHEIFNRGLTREGTEKREACLSRYVVSLVCPACHTTVQNDPQANRELLAFNRDLWGEDVVNEHIRYMREINVRVDFQDRLGEYSD